MRLSFLSACGFESKTVDSDLNGTGEIYYCNIIDVTQTKYSWGWGGGGHGSAGCIQNNGAWARHGMIVNTAKCKSYVNEILAKRLVIALRTASMPNLLSPAQLPRSAQSVCGSIAAIAFQSNFRTLLKKLELFHAQVNHGLE